MLLVIQHSVIVCLALEAMHLLDVHQFQSNEIQSIHASHHHAAIIHYVQLKMEPQDVHVFHHTLVMLMEADADRNAFTIQIVPADWLAYVSIVEIHAQAFAVIIQSAKSLIMCQFALARETIMVIHSLVVDQ